MPDSQNRLNDALGNTSVNRGPRLRRLRDAICPPSTAIDAGAAESASDATTTTPADATT